MLPANEPVVIVLLPGDQPRPVPDVCYTPNAIHGHPSSDSLRREVARLLGSSRSSFRSGRSYPLGKVSSLVLILRLNSDHTQIYSSSPPMSNKERKARMWHNALQKKLSAAKMMLAAQKTIEEIEEEIGLSVPRDTLNKMHSEFYHTGDTGDPTAETYLATISAIRVEQ
jgi:hypothetical protein